jgi:hypothetical protein
MVKITGSSVGTSIFAADRIPAQEAELFGLMSTVGQGLRRKRNKDLGLSSTATTRHSEIGTLFHPCYLVRHEEAWKGVLHRLVLLVSGLGFWNVEAFGLIRTTTPVPPCLLNRAGTYPMH